MSSETKDRLLLGIFLGLAAGLFMSATYFVLYLVVVVAAGGIFQLTLLTTTGGFLLALHRALYKDSDDGF